MSPTGTTPEAPQGPVGKRRPCAHCPWRTDVYGPTDIPRWQSDLASQLAATCRDDGMKVMSCHEYPPGAEQVCAGFAMQIGYHSIGLRLLHLLGQYDPAQFEAGSVPLHPGFEAMLRAHDVPVPPRNRWEGARRGHAHRAVDPLDVSCMKPGRNCVPEEKP